MQKKYLIAVVLKEFHFLLREGGHGDGLDPVGRVEAPPGTHTHRRRQKKRRSRSINSKSEKIPTKAGEVCGCVGTGYREIGATHAHSKTH